MSDILLVEGAGRQVWGRPSPGRPTGLFMGPKSFEGWQGLGARRREQLARAVSDGDHDVPVKLPSRLISIEPGVIVAHEEDELQGFVDSVNAWGATGERFKLTVTQNGSARYAIVRVLLADAKATQARSSGTLQGEMALQFVAADPRQFGIEPNIYPVDAGATTVVETFGEFPSHPIIEIPDAPAYWAVSSPGGTFSVAGAPAGGTHKLDMRTGRVYRDGVWLRGVGRGPLWAIPARDAWWHTLSAAGRIIAPDTWV